MAVYVRLYNNVKLRLELSAGLKSYCFDIFSGLRDEISCQNSQLEAKKKILERELA